MEEGTKRNEATRHTTGRKRERNRTQCEYLIGGAVTVHLAVTSGIPLPVCGETFRGSFTSLHRFSKMAHLVPGVRAEARARFREDSRFSDFGLKVAALPLMPGSTTSSGDLHRSEG